MFEIGRICIKIAGRDAGMKCVIVDVLDKNHVLIDGQTRRRKCNIRHLEPLDQTVKVTKNAPKTEIIRVFKEMKIEIKETKAKKKTERPKKVRKKKQKPVKPAKQPVKEKAKTTLKAETKMGTKTGTEKEKKKEPETKTTAPPKKGEKK